uniref:U25-Liphistoxin-Lm1k_1 n=1 Tax=Liphistius malayanus TaxID=1203467 RepID=A0A482ZBF6_9ARAC
MNCVLSILILSTACSVAYSGGCIYAKFTPRAHTLQATQYAMQPLGKYSHQR